MLFAQLDDGGRFDGLVAGTTLGIQESEEFLQRVGIGRVAQEGALPADSDETFVFEFVEVMGQRGRRDAHFRLNLANDHTFGVRGQKNTQNPQAGLCSESCEHVGIGGGAVSGVQQLSCS